MGYQVLQQHFSHRLLWYWQSPLTRHELRTLFSRDVFEKGKNLQIWINLQFDSIVIQNLHKWTFDFWLVSDLKVEVNTGKN